MSVMKSPLPSIAAVTSESAASEPPGKMYLERRVGGRGAVEAADGVDQRHALVFEEAAHDAKVGGIVCEADVLEHADRDDAIVAAFFGAIILQCKFDLAALNRAGRSRAGALELGRTQRDAFNADIADVAI